MPQGECIRGEEEVLCWNSVAVASYIDVNLCCKKKNLPPCWSIRPTQISPTHSGKVPYSSGGTAFSSRRLSAAQDFATGTSLLLADRTLWDWKLTTLQNSCCFLPNAENWVNFQKSAWVLPTEEGENLTWCMRARYSPLSFAHLSTRLPILASTPAVMLHGQPLNSLLWYVVWALLIISYFLFSWLKQVCVQETGEY